jgi:hypothetical protein
VKQVLPAAQVMVAQVKDEQAVAKSKEEENQAVRRK